MIRLLLILSVSAAVPISPNVDKEASEKDSVVGDILDGDVIDGNGLRIHSSHNSNRDARLLVEGGDVVFSGSIGITGDHGHMENINIASVIVKNAPQDPQHGQSSNENTPVCDTGPYLLKADCFCKNTNNGGVPCAAGLICEDGECLNKGKFPCSFNDDLLAPKVKEDGQMSPHDTSELFKWENNVIPYYYSDENTDAEDKELIRSIMDRIKLKTCFKFEEKSKAELHDDKMKHCLEIFIEDSLCSGGCSGAVKKVEYYKRLQLYLSAHVTKPNGDDCGYKGLIIHELMHALGVAHTQRRNDRDNFIEVNFDSLDGASETIINQYKKCEKCKLYDSIPYDCGSIMHYGTHYKRKEVIVPRGTCELFEFHFLFSTDDATDKDWELLNIIGNCDA